MTLCGIPGSRAKKGDPIRKGMGDIVPCGDASTLQNVF